MIKKLLRKIYIFFGNKKILIASSLFIIVLVLIYVFNSSISRQNIEKKLNMDTDYSEVIWSVAAKNNIYCKNLLNKRTKEWKYLPLSKKFLRKYNEKDGILINIDYDEVGGSVVPSENDKNKQIVRLYVCWGMKDDRYYIHYILNDFNELDDVEIVDIKHITDERGRDIEFSDEEDAFESPSLLEADNNEYNEFIRQICTYPYDSSEISIFERVQFTEKAEKKLGYNSIFGVEYEDFRYNLQVEILEGTDFDKKIAFVKIWDSDYLPEEKYKLSFVFNDNGALDDYIVEKLDN